MDFLINESQLRVILTEQDESKMTEYAKTMHSFTKNLVNRVSKTYGLNLQMLMTWGTSVGGMVLPLDQYIRTGEFNLTEDQRYLILSGIAFILFFNNKKAITKIVGKIKEEGIEETFKVVLSKAKDLKSSFKNFLLSINVSMGSFIDVVAYSFLIPIITDIQDVVSRAASPKEAMMIITQRLIASGVVLIGSQALSVTIKKIINRIS